MSREMEYEGIIVEYNAGGLLLTGVVTRRLQIPVRLSYGKTYHNYDPDRHREILKVDDNEVIICKGKNWDGNTVWTISFGSRGFTITDLDDHVKIIRLDDSDNAIFSSLIRPM